VEKHKFKPIAEANKKGKGPGDGDSFLRKALEKQNEKPAKIENKRESKSPPKTVKEIKQTASRLFKPTASVKGKYGSRFSSTEDELRNGAATPTRDKDILAETKKVNLTKKQSLPEKDRLPGAQKYSNQA